MKCDELEKSRIVLSEEGYLSGHVEWFKNVYNAKEVDAAIAELKQTIDELVGVKKSAKQILQNLLDCGLIKEWYFNGTFNVVLKADDLHPQIAELKQKLEDVQASAYADSVDAGMRERRLRRALYKACANWAMNARMVEIEAEPWGENHESRLWAGVYDKCLKKAEEYK